MDMEYSEQMDYDFDEYNSEPFTYLPEFDEHIEELNLNFIYPFNSQVICSSFNNLGTILVIINDQEIVNIKFTVNCYDKKPLKIRKSSKFSSISGREIISDQFYTYIHDKNGDLYKFRSSQSLDKIKHQNVLYLQCFNFNDTCYFVMIAITDLKIVLYIYDKSFDKDYSGYLRCVDLIIQEDAIQPLENEFTIQKIYENYTFSSEMLSNISENDLDIDFFNRFLDIDVEKEKIRDILLVSMNDRLFYIKYCGNADEGNQEMTEASADLISIETVIISRGRIKAIKYLNSSVIILNDFWVLTVFYQCVTTNIIKRTEIPLGDEISCYRFTKNQLIYSNRHKIIFMKFRIFPSEPKIFEVNLRLVATFSVAQNEEFLVAIDRNKFFYYVPIPKYSNSNEMKESQQEYTEITKERIKKFPEAIKYFEKVEEEFNELRNNIQSESDMLLLLTHLKQTNNVTAGQAKIKYLPFLTPSQEDDIICDPINSQSGHSYIRIVLNLERIFSAFNFTLAFYRHTANNGTLVRHMDISPRDEKTSFAVYVPGEINDCADNKLELFAHFYINKHECHVLQFPFIIDKIKTSSTLRIQKNIEVENCIKALNKLLKDNNK